MNKRDYFLIKIVSFFWITSKLWSINAWLPGREYPQISLLPEVMTCGIVLTVLSIVNILLLLTTLFRVQKWMLIVLVASELLLIATDYLFMQPWEYIFLFIFFAKIVLYQRHKMFFTIVTYFIASVYLLSAIHKFNRTFLIITWDRFILNDILGIPHETVVQYNLMYLGLILPSIELILGLLLLFNKFKKIAAYFLIAMHILILIVLGPFGESYNSIIWIWNLAMIAILLNIMGQEISKKFLKVHFAWHLAIFIFPLIGIFFGSNSYITFNLYSGKNDMVYVRSAIPFPQNIPYDVNASGKHPYYIILQNWAMEETTLPPPSDQWYLKRMVKKLQERFPNDQVEKVNYQRK